MSVPASVKEVNVSATASTWAFDRMEGIGAAHGQASALSDLMGKPAPEFELEMLEGDTFKLGDELGKRVIVLDFWATWCGPCLKALPEVMAAVSEFESDDVRLVTINQQESAAKVRKFIGAKVWDMEVALDSDLRVRDLYSVEGIPTTVIIAKDGKVSMVHSGFSPGLKERLVDDISRALEAGKEKKQKE